MDLTDGERTACVCVCGVESVESVFASGLGGL